MAQGPSCEYCIYGAKIFISDWITEITDLIAVTQSFSQQESQWVVESGVSFAIRSAIRLWWRACDQRVNRPPSAHRQFTLDALGTEYRALRWADKLVDNRTQIRLVWYRTYLLQLWMAPHETMDSLLLLVSSQRLQLSYYNVSLPEVCSLIIQPKLISHLGLRRNKCK